MKTIEKLENKIKELEDKIRQYEYLLQENNIKYFNEEIQIVESSFSNEEKVNIYLDYFRGRSDCFAIRWEKDSKSGYAPFYHDVYRYLPKNEKNKIPFKELYKPLAKKDIVSHLLGNETLGLYPMLEDQTCFLLAFDFDGPNFKKDVLSLSNVCNEFKLDNIIEISRSGKGAHLWLFFENKVLAKDARRLGRFLISKAINEKGLSSFRSFDRMFPAQDYIEPNGMGNLIVFPLNGKSGKLGNTLFVDNDFIPFENQYLKLKDTKKISNDLFMELLSLINKENELGLFNDNTNKIDINALDFNIPLIINIENHIKIEKSGNSINSIQFLKRLSSVVNPEFYKKQSMRVSTYGISRVIELYEEGNEYLYLPTGIIKSLMKTLDDKKILYELIDHRTTPKSTNKISFKGVLKEEQKEVFKEVISHNEGIIVAPTGFGKTVLGISLITKHNLKTLIIVNRKNLAKQWEDKIKEFTNVNDTGRLYDSINTLGSDIDIALIQSLSSYDKLDDIVKSYGLIIIDEVHHMAAISYERLIRKFWAKNIFGLTATINRSDGLEKVVTTMIGPVITEVDIDNKNLDKNLVVRFTNSKVPNDEILQIQDVYQKIVEDNYRTKLILEDIKIAIESNKYILVLTDRINHLETLHEEIKKYTNNVFVIHGRKNNKKRIEFEGKIKNVDDGFIIISTGKYIGEGFDNDRLNTLFLTMPFRWKGTLEQYVGRLNRERKNKKIVTVYDYVDINISYFSSMYLNRLKGYKKLGFNISSSNDYVSSIYNNLNYEEVLYKDLGSAKDIVLIGKTFNQFKLEQILNTNKNIKPKQYFESKNSSNIIIIDNRFIWYGSINPFSFNNNDKDIMRIDDANLAAELIKENENKNL